MSVENEEKKLEKTIEKANGQPSSKEAAKPASHQPITKPSTKQQEASKKSFAIAKQTLTSGDRWTERQTHTGTWSHR
jgi:hypothetical protein